MTNDSLKTVEKLFTPWTALIYQNVPYLETTQFSILKLKTMYCNHKTYQRHMVFKCTLSD